MVERLSVVARAVRVAEHVDSFPAPRGTGITVDEAVAAVQEARDAS